LPALMRRDLVPQNVVYRVRIRTENGKGIDFFASEGSTVDTMSVCMRPGEMEHHGSMLGLCVPNLDTPKLRH
jgi:hypothetical protein